MSNAPLRLRLGHGFTLKWKIANQLAKRKQHAVFGRSMSQ
jgi:hypothetical protein